MADGRVIPAPWATLQAHAEQRARLESTQRPVAHTASPVGDAGHQWCIYCGTELTLPYSDTSWEPGSRVITSPLRHHLLELPHAPIPCNQAPYDWAHAADASTSRFRAAPSPLARTWQDRLLVAVLIVTVFVLVVWAALAYAAEPNW